MAKVITNEMVFELLEKETLLEGLQRTGHHVEYQCRSGYCGACRLPLIRGEVFYLKPPLAWVCPGEVLPCCSRPQGDITLDVSLHDVLSQLVLSDEFDSQLKLIQNDFDNSD